MTIVVYHTIYSSYQVHPHEKLIRRVRGENPPTRNQGPDDTWKAYERLEYLQAGLLIVWGESDGILRRTLTSPVVDVETVNADDNW